MHIFHNWKKTKDTYENTVYECQVCGMLKVVPYEPVYGSARPPIVPPPKNLNRRTINHNCKCGHPIPPPTKLIITTFWRQSQARRIVKYRCPNCKKINKVMG